MKKKKMRERQKKVKGKIFVFFIRRLITSSVISDHNEGKLKQENDDNNDDAVKIFLYSRSYVPAPPVKKIFLGT